MKKTIIIAFAALSMAFMQGCMTNEHADTTESCVKSNAFGASFNDQQYVWEGFIFSTNKVENVK